MKLSSSRRFALGVGLILATAHCNGDDEETMVDASTDARVVDAVVSDMGNADARESDGSGGSDGDSSSASDGSGGIDGAADSVDGAAVDASDAEASSSAVDTGADGSLIPIVDAGRDTGAVVDALSDVPLIPDDAGPTFAHVKQIFTLHCGACHGEATATKHIDLVTAAGLRERLVAPLAVAQGFCGVDGGADGGGTALHAIVPGNTAESYLYQKIVAGPPVTCGMRMPRMGPAGCDKVDGGNICLSQGDTDAIKQWIEANAPE